jgi:hypothetical protein
MPPTENGRTFDRFRQRVSCVIRDGVSKHQGFVTDMSASGVFLQTRGRLSTGKQVVVDLDFDGQTMTLTGEITRVRQSNRSAVQVSTGGFGLRIQSAPEAYFQLIMDLHAKPS